MDNDVFFQMSSRITILKLLRDFLLYTNKETSSVLFAMKYGCHHGSRSVLLVRAIKFTFR